MSTLGQFLIGHLLGDFLLQTGWMAKNKSQSDFACWVHVGVYGCALSFVGLPLWFVVANCILHFFIDRNQLQVAWMRMMRQDWGPLDSVGRLCVDQSLHLVSGFALLSPGIALFS